MDNEIQKELHKGMIALIDAQNERMNGISEAILTLSKVIDHGDKIGELNINAIGQIFEKLKEFEEKFDKLNIND